MKKYSIKELVYISLMIALNIVLGRITSIRLPIAGIEGVRIGFGGLPIIFAGIVLGPIAGGIVGGIGDLVGHFLNPMGAYMPHFTITAALTGIIPGLLLKAFKKSKYSFGQLVIAIGIGQTITSVLLVPYLLDKLFSVPMIASLPGNILNQAIHVPLYAFVIKILIERLAPFIMNFINDQ